TLEELEWSLGQNYPFTPMDATWQHHSHLSSIQTSQHPPSQEQHTTRHFPSTHLPSPTHNQQRRDPHNHPTIASDLLQEQTGQNMAVPITSTTTGQNPDLSLDASPSWSSAMTNPLQITHFYSYPDQV